MSREVDGPTPPPPDCLDHLSACPMGGHANLITLAVLGLFLVGAFVLYGATRPEPRLCPFPEMRAGVMVCPDAPDGGP